MPLFCFCNQNYQNGEISSTVLHGTVAKETLKVSNNHQSEDGDFVSPVTHTNKELNFDDTLGFDTPPSVPFIASHSSPVDINDCQAYLSLVSDVLSFCLSNYYTVRVPLPLVFNWNYLQNI